MTKANDRLELRVLGPIGVVIGDRSIELGATKAKALLVRLLMDRGHTVPAETLVEALWSTTDRTASEATLRSTVSRLRRKLATAGVRADFIVTRSPGYLLNVDANSVDALRFEELCRAGESHLVQADLTQASRLLSDALDLWRGPALLEVRQDSFALAEARRLEEMRLRAIEIRAEAELRRGNHRELEDELEALTLENWTRERLWSLRMLALHRSGRSEEALAVFEQLRTALESTSGLTPGPEVEKLALDIREDNPSLDWHAQETSPASPPAQPGVPLPPLGVDLPSDGLFGRTDEFALLTTAFEEARQQGKLHAAFIGGDPGMGKSSLIAHWAAHAHRNGATVLFGGAREEVGTPYQPFRMALNHLVRHASPDLLNLLAPFTASLVEVMPTLASHIGVAGRSPTTDPDAARHLWFRSVVGALDAAARLSPVVLILDDLQWADVPTLRLLRHLVLSGVNSRIIIVGVFRETDVISGRPLADLLGDTRRAPHVVRVTLKGLDHIELLGLMEAVAGQPMETEGLRLRDVMLAETDGNPFYVRELLQHLVDTGALYRSEGKWVPTTQLLEHGLPVSVREVIQQRVRRLGEPAAYILSVASVVGRAFDFKVLVAASAYSEEVVFDVLDAATAAGLIVNAEGDRHSFVHALIEHALYENADPELRARTHASVAREIEHMTYLAADQRVIALAHHWSQTGESAHQITAGEYAYAAGQSALEKLAPDEALRWFNRSLALIDGSPADDLRCGALIGLGRAQLQSGIPAFRETLLRAAHLAQDLQSVPLLVEAALANNRGYFSVGGALDVERVGVLEAAGAAIAGRGDADEARLLGLLALELTFGGDLTRRRELMERALAIARQAGPSALAAVGSYALTALNAPDALTERLEISAEAFEAAVASGDAILQFWCAYWRAGVLVQAGDIHGFHECLSMAKGIADRVAQPTLQWNCLYSESCAAIIAGDIKEAERLALLAAELGAATGQTDTGAIVAVQLGIVRRMQGRGEEVIDLIRKAAMDNPGIPGFATGLAAFLIDLNRFDEARSTIAPFLAPEQEPAPLDMMWAFVMAQRAYVVAALDWVEPAQELFDQLLPFADQFVYATATFFGQVNYHLARLATTLGHHDEAEAYFALAEANHLRMGANWCLALTWLGWGELMSRHNDGPRPAQAVELLERALNAARQHGYGFIASRSASLLESMGG